MPITHTPLGRGAHAGSTRSHERIKPDSIQRPVLLRTHPGTAVRLRPLLAMLAARQMKRTRKYSPPWSQRPDMFPLHDVEYLRCMHKQATKLFERTRVVGQMPTQHHASRWGAWWSQQKQPACLVASGIAPRKRRPNPKPGWRNHSEGMVEPDGIEPTTSSLQS